MSYSPQVRGVKPVEIASSRAASSGAERVFDMLLCDSLTEVFNTVLGRIAGQALLDAVKRHTSLELEDFPAKPNLLDEALTALTGKAAKVLERKILKTVTGKISGGTEPVENEFDFAAEISKAKQQFLKRKQAANHPRTLG
jgi:hypothetical protein